MLLVAPIPRSAGAEPSCDARQHPLPTDSFRFPANAEGSRSVYRIPPNPETANGSAVLLMHEIDGLTCKTVRFAKLLAEAGFAVYAPHLFGGVYREQPLRNAVRLQFSGDWKLHARARTSPVVDWLRELAAQISERHGGRAIGAIGMCLTGILPVALMSEDAVGAAVVSQPSLPLISLGSNKRALGLDEADLERAVSQRGVRILGFRFARDGISPRERFDRLRELFDERFIDCEVSRAEFGESAHSVLTLEYPAPPSARRVAKTIEFLERELRGVGRETPFECPEQSWSAAPE